MIRTYLEWIVDLPWERVDRGPHRPARGAQGPRPRPLRHREGQGPHPRVPRGAQAEARRALLDPLLRRPARRRQDLARASRSPSAMGRKFERISVGGVRDESEIRGHRRTYVGAHAGHDRPRAARRRLEQPGADDRRDRQDGRGLPRRPVERDARGARPRAEPELPRPLPRPAVRPLERLLHHAPPTSSTRSRRRCATGWRSSSSSGYTEEEKLEIAKRYLVPRQIERNGLTTSKIEFTDDALKAIIEGYTREAGRAQPRARDRLGVPQGRARVRGGQRASRSARSAREDGARAARQAPGRRPTHAKRRTRRARAWPPAWRGRRSAATCCSSRPPRIPGEGKLQITGQLGDVMKESAAAALSYVKAQRRGARDGEVAEDWFATHDLHVHVPAGAVPKDGPSAGITMATALVVAGDRAPGALRHRDDRARSRSPGRCCRSAACKEKALAAQRAGITRVIAPKLNEPDLEDFPENLLGEMEFTFVERVDAGARARARAAEVAPFARRSAAGRAGRTRRRARTLDAGGVTPKLAPGYGLPARSSRFEESHGIKEEEGRKGRRRRSRRRPGRRDEPVRAALVEDEELRDNLRTAFESARRPTRACRTARAPPRRSLTTRRPRRS